MSDSNTFPFGKWRGQTIATIAAKDPGYLQWAMGTDIPQRYPEMALVIQCALQSGVAEATIPPINEVMLVAEDLPALSATVRGGGRLHDGVNNIMRITLDGLNLSRKSVPLDRDNRSQSGASGTYGWETPSDDGCYMISQSGGSIANQSHRETYWLMRGGKWKRIDGDHRAVVAVLRDQDAAN